MWLKGGRGEGGKHTTFAPGARAQTAAGSHPFPPALLSTWGWGGSPSPPLAKCFELKGASSAHSPGTPRVFPPRRGLCLLGSARWPSSHSHGHPSPLQGDGLLGFLQGVTPNGLKDSGTSCPLHCIGNWCLIPLDASGQPAPRVVPSVSLR